MRRRTSGPVRRRRGPSQARAPPAGYPNACGAEAGAAILPRSASEKVKHGPCRVRAPARARRRASTVIVRTAIIVSSGIGASYAYSPGAAMAPDSATVAGVVPADVMMPAGRQGAGGLAFDPAAPAGRRPPPCRRILACAKGPPAQPRSGQGRGPGRRRGAIARQSAVPCRETGDCKPL